eukprot:GILI01036496.1.p1 GENE.GILI01036496.1~~GILI01036496.1.p1  ORF type:complete len:335 (+),score=45.14 GILI01036496.1:47-1051(+)
MAHHIGASEKSSGPSGVKGLIFGPGGAAALSGIIEISLFHPFDTCSKRLMKNSKPVLVAGDWSASRRNFKNVIFSGMEVGLGAQTSMGMYLAHLYPGSIYAVYYKVLQRFIKFAGQPYVKDWMQNISNATTTATNGVSPPSKKSKLLLEACAGSIVGMSEAILLPIDRMKVLSQTNASTIQGRSMVRIMADEGIKKMYAAVGTTIFRNCIGSFLLFGGSALTKEFVFGLEDYRKATVTQNLVASAIGATMGVVVTSPMDVVKTRLQSSNLKSSGGAATASVSGFEVVSNTLKTEGPQAFFKGITPKLVTTAPRLIFSYTFSLYATSVLRSYGSK